MSGEVVHGAMPPVMCGECQLGSHMVYGPTFQKAPEAICMRRREVRTFPPGRAILREDNVPTLAYAVYSGWAICFKQHGDGRRQILNFVLPGDTIPLMALCFHGQPLPFSIKALTTVVCCSFDIRDMSTLLQGSLEQAELLSLLHLNTINMMCERVFDLGRRAGRGRLARLLLTIYRRIEKLGIATSGKSFPFPPTQENLADALGLTSAHVNRILSQFRREHILMIEGDWLTIQDVNELQRIADEE